VTGNAYEFMQNNGDMLTNQSREYKTISEKVVSMGQSGKSIDEVLDYLMPLRDQGKISEAEMARMMANAGYNFE